MIYLSFYPDSQFLYNISFAFASGPLLIAVLVLRNSFVPHSIEHITNLSIHILPSLTLWSIKTSECSDFVNSMVTMSIWDFCMNSMMVYIVWTVFYSLIIFYLTPERTERKGNLTMYKYIMENERVHKSCGLLGESFRPVMFMGQHALGSFLLIVFAYFQLNYHWVHTSWVFFICCYGIWNGACYYIEIFSKRYEKDIHNIEKISS